ncbi:N-glycosylation protein eos1 [Neolecta irregularis DAH-3]|uniref:N-glycosylation protein eos1 n=1 Tax=Neolecta irregularis (strain DAH-3) TaxID=1198029 RepID=A0A1U7LU81_NEOID|nr:N-glycosylation protein eos1 [Neolecta irregularis DAH-3]|eukprot:OLL26230.1 N-glycosylation protein eos1 [Neolecta irregularis DAH-3]
MFANGMLDRWLVRYSPQATIIRLLSLTALNCVITNGITTTISSGYEEFLLPSWIGISCVLTVAYTIQDYITSNVFREPDRKRQLNLKEVAVFGVVPVGFAGFLSLLLALWKIHQLRVKGCY